MKVNMNMDSDAYAEPMVYYDIPPYKFDLLEQYTTEMYYTYIRKTLIEAVAKRIDSTDRELGFFLSGGLDSSLVVGIATRICGLKRPRTFSIGMVGSPDLAFAREVSEFLDTDHTEVFFTADEAVDAIPKVIRALETYDITTIRASIPSYLLAKYINTHTKIRVIMNGDGSDELFGGYLYFNNAPNDQAFQAECERLLNDIHTFDVLRSDRSISANGLEARTPFLDKQFVSVVRSIQPSYLRPIPGKQMEKYILRSAFDDGSTLPPEVLWRRKEAFSDGVSTPEKAWFQEIQDRVAALVPVDWKEKSLLSFSHHMTPKTPEEYYYRFLFTSYYGLAAIRVTVPYRWMPKWCPETNDPSARTLQMYNEPQTGSP
jgi:asparagine synthase (glutamine-hydrolysing)